MDTLDEFLISMILFIIVLGTTFGIWSIYGAQWGLPALVIVLVVGSLRLLYIYKKNK